MLYHFHEMQHLALSPYRAWLKASRAAVKPLQHSPVGRPLAAGLEMAERLTRRYGKPEFGIRHVNVNGDPVRVREEIADETSFCNLLHFKKEGVSDQPKVLMVAPMSGHYATLLRGTVEAMLPDHDVYITDWTDARDVPARAGQFHLDDYIELLTWYIQLLGDDCHAMAVCQPSVPLMAAVAVQSQEINEGRIGHIPKTMTLMGGPVDTRESPTAVNQFAKERDLAWFKSHSIHRVPMVYPGMGREVYPGFLQLQGFMGMNIDRHMNAHTEHFWNLVKGDGDGATAHRKFYDEYMSVMDLPAEYFLETIDAVFLSHSLPKGELMYRGRKVDPSQIKDTALLTIEGELDDISGVGQTSAAHAITPDIPATKRGTHVQKDVGHYGIFNGRKWRGIIQPLIAEFIKTHGGASGATQSKAKKSNGSKG